MASGDAVSVIRALRLMRQAQLKQRTTGGDKDHHNADNDDDQVVHAFLEPISMTDLGDIKKQAQIRYQKSQRRDKLKGGKNVGVPRVVYKELLHEIKEEVLHEEKVRQRKLQRKKEMEEAQALEAQIIAKMNAEKAVANASLPAPPNDKQSLDTRSMEDVIPSDGESLQTAEERFLNRMPTEDLEIELAERHAVSMSEEDQDGRHLRRVMRIKSSYHISEKDMELALRKRLMGQARRASVAPGGGMAPKDVNTEKNRAIQQAQKRREDMHQKRERETLLVIKDKEDRITRRQQKAAREHLITTWLVISTTCSRVEKMISGVLQLRDETEKWSNASKEKKSVRTIELWWPNRFTELKMKRNPEKMMNLRVGVRKLWCKIQIRKRHSSCNLVQQFIRDTTGMGETVKKIYAFRAKIIMVQNHVRDFFKIKLARLRNLMVYWDYVEAREREKMSRAEELMNTKSREAADKIKGFGETLRKIDTVAEGVQTLHAREDERTKWRAMADNKAPSTNVVLQVGNLTLMQWVDRVKKYHPGGEEKIEYCTKLLAEARKRHIIAQDASLVPVEDRKPIQLSIKDAAMFLRDGSERLDVLGSRLDPERSSAVRKSFMMHTGSGRHAMDKIDTYIHKQMVKEFRVMKEERANRD